MALDGIDLGYFSVKAVSTSARGTLFLSQVGETHETTYSLVGNQHGQITIGENSYNVGRAAQLESDYLTSRRDPEWVFSEHYQILLKYALSELHKSSTSVKLVTGLPLEYYNELAGKIDQVFLGDHTFKRSDGTWQTVTVEDVFVITQPYGTHCDMSLNTTGQVLNNVFAEGMIGWADIGGGTLNLLAVNKMEEVGRWTLGAGLGLLNALDNMAAAIKSKHPGFSPTAHEVALWVGEGSFPYGGERVSIEPFLGFLEPPASAVVQSIVTTWDEPKRFDAIGLTGAGTLSLKPLILGQLAHIYGRVEIPDDPVFANAKGYLKLARKVFG